MIFIKKAFSLIMAITFTFMAMSLSACGQTQQPTQEDANSAILEEIFIDAEEISYNPLTGEALPEGTQAGRRPIAIMVNNAKASLPQRGVAAADAVVEMVTEGGITRLLALYSDPQAVPQVGSVRSARDQHLQFAVPLNAIVVHIGTSIYASNLLNTYAYQTVDGRTQGTTAFWFDELRATTRANEHCWYTDANLIAQGIANKQIATTGKSYPLVNFAAADASPRTLTQGDAPDVVFNFSDINQTEFLYDANAGVYRKYTYGEPHSDEEGEQLSYKNVLILFTPVGLKEDGYCIDFDLMSGQGVYLYNGKYENITWNKGAVESPLTIKGENGEDITINTGKTYIGVVGTEYYDTLKMDKNAVTEAVTETVG